MLVKELLKLASECKSQTDVDALFHRLEENFAQNKLLGLSMYNSEAFLEGDGAFVRYELIQQISDHYLTSIQPEIRRGKFEIVVTTSFMMDGLGICSKSCRLVPGMDDILEAHDESKLSDLEEQAYTLAIANHAKLISRVGVPDALARDVATKCW